ncbi:MAG: pilus assembly PilX family protein [Janthinobacterium lividum]
MDKRQTRSLPRHCCQLPAGGAGGRSQRGSVLIITLVMLIVLTMLVLAAMSTNTAEERMAGNARDWNTAFQAAEAALRDAQRDIAKAPRISGATNFEAGCSTAGLCLLSTTGTPNWIVLNAGDAGWIGSSDDAVASKSVKYGTYTAAPTLNTASVTLAAAPRYIIEVMPLQDGGSIKKPQAGGASTSYYYRVTAVGFGQNLSSRVMLQAVYRQ